MDSAEIAMTTDELEAEMDVEMDAENGDVMNAKTTDEMTNEKNAKMLKTETREPHMTGEVPPDHPDSPRVRVTRRKAQGVAPKIH